MADDSPWLWNRYIVSRYRLKSTGNCPFRSYCIHRGSLRSYLDEGGLERDAMSSRGPTSGLVKCHDPISQPI